MKILRLFLSTLENRNILYPAVIISAVLLYTQVIYFTFSPLDDPGLIENRLDKLTDMSHLGEIFMTPLEMGPATYFYRPVLELSFVADALIGKGSPWQFHFTNLLYHILTISLFYYLLQLLYIRKLRAGILTYLFALHPVNVSVAGWIPARNDSLLAILLLLGLITYSRYIHKPSTTHLIVHLGIFFLSLFTKENAIVIPVILLAYHFLIAGKHLKSSFKPAVGWSILTVIYLGVRYQVFNETATVYNFHPTSEILINSAVTFLIYLGKLIYPVHQSIMPDFIDTPLLPNIFLTVTIVLILIISITQNRHRGVFGVIFFLTVIFIPLFWGTAIGLSIPYEHRLYVPMLGILIAVSDIRLPSGKLKIVSLAVLLIYLAILPLKSANRIRVYQDKDTFTRRVVIESPSLWQAHALRAEYYANSNQPFKSIDAYSRALDVIMDPNTRDLYYSRGIQYQMTGNISLALADYEEVEKLDPDFPDVFYNRGVIFRMQNSLEEAVINFSRSISLDNDNPLFYKARGECYLKSGLYDLAIKDLSFALSLTPEDTEALTNRSVSYFFNNNYSSAYEDLIKIEGMNKFVNPEFKQALLEKYKPEIE